MRKYIYGFFVLIGSMIISNVIGGEIGGDAGNADMTSGIFNTGINKVVASINLLIAIIVFCTFSIVEEIRKNK